MIARKYLRKTRDNLAKRRKELQEVSRNQGVKVHISTGTEELKLKIGPS